MGVNVVALVVLVVFYLVILAVGIVAAWKVKVKGREIGVTGGLETTLVAGRDLKTVIGIFTMIATTVGGGYINGTAESIAKDGMIWTLAPLGIFIGLNLGGAFYARRMRDCEYLTMLDPFQLHYGHIVTVLIYIASLMGDLLWSASILNALGTTLSVIANIQLTVAVIMSGSVTTIYTMIGSMISVAYTDVVQLAFIFIGLMLSLPFIFTNEKIGDFSANQTVWLGHVESNMWGLWVDLLIAMTLGTIPWQSYFQRVLSVKSAKQAQVLSFVGAVGALVLVIPSVMIGIAGASADWRNTTQGRSPMETNQSSLILPIVINEFTPSVVSIFGLGAISAAVMSSMDSAVLGSSSMFTHNIYSEIFRRNASKIELRIVQVVAVIFIGCICMFIALSSSVIYGMFILAADFVFVIIFPQLTAILYCPKFTNTLGSVAGYLVGFLLRVGAGEPLINMPVWIYFPEICGQMFPFRTFAMIVSFVTIVVVTFLTRLKPVSRFFIKFERTSADEERSRHLMQDRSGMTLAHTDSSDSEAEKSKQIVSKKENKVDEMELCSANGKFRKIDS
ncbi:high-affinity choline transporter 1 [Biomphalaria pfeifferi]|uniref:High-affinity choline transporter 1 n=1 Tax=Biomphalaria pfeifferi TaxID=112525 RepID=A0AAD8BNW1_BIOPF|nr:high-affinity choline transporter 1 [Biomphalaria pfeifferi]